MSFADTLLGMALLIFLVVANDAVTSSLPFGKLEDRALLVGSVVALTIPFNMQLPRRSPGVEGRGPFAPHRAQRR